MRIIVTGGLGFIGSHFVRKIVNDEPKDTILYNIDNMSRGSNTANVEDIRDNSNYNFIRNDINNVSVIPSLKEIDILVNFAAQTHVDRSIADPVSFMNSNYTGTLQLLEYTRKHDVKLFVQISTDEVYGEATNDISFKEIDPLNPGNPYSASKAAADLLVSSFVRTYGLKAIVTRCTNNFGPNQSPEKLIPKTIIMILLSMPIYLYGNGLQIRDWLYVTDHINAVYSLIHKGRNGEIYNISASNHKTNLEIVKKVGSIIENKVQKAPTIMFTRDRPGHDRRYSIDCTKLMQDTDWKPSLEFDIALEKTVDWYLNNHKWWQDQVDNSISEPQPWTLRYNQS